MFRYVNNKFIVIVIKFIISIYFFLWSVFKYVLINNNILFLYKYIGNNNVI